MEKGNTFKSTMQRENSKGKAFTGIPSISRGDKPLLKPELDSPLPRPFSSLAMKNSLLPTVKEAEEAQEKFDLIEMEKKRIMEMSKRLTDPRPLMEIASAADQAKVVAWAAASASKSPAFCRAMIRIKRDAYLFQNRKMPKEIQRLAEDDKSLFISKTAANIANYDMKPNAVSGTSANTVTENWMNDQIKYEPGAMAMEEDPIMFKKAKFWNDIVIQENIGGMKMVKQEAAGMMGAIDYRPPVSKKPRISNDIVIQEDEMMNMIMIPDTDA